VDEARDKKGIANYDVSDWKLIDREPNVPQQMNGVDCGAFTVMCADFISDNLPLDYEQEDMLFFRRKITADILRGSLRYTIE
jgi:sentrin-specific protease 1